MKCRKCGSMNIKATGKVDSSQAVYVWNVDCQTCGAWDVYGETIPASHEWEDPTPSDGFV